MSIIGKATPTTDVATTNFSITSQAPFASASGTNRNPGAMVFTIPAPAAGGAEASFTFKEGAANVIQINTLNLGAGWSNLVFTGGNIASNSGGNMQVTTDGGGVSMQPGSVASGIFLTTGVQLGSVAAAFGGGVKVVGITNATTNPTTNPAGGVIIYSELTTGHLKTRGSLGAVSTMAPAGSAGTINSQQQILDRQVGTCRTVSSATPTAALAYPTVSGSGGLLRIKAVSRAVTTGTGIAVGDSATSTYEVAYKNVAGTVTLDTTGITLQGTARTTAAALTAPALTATVATNVITILVTNVNLCTIDSQVVANVNAA